MNRSFWLVITTACAAATIAMITAFVVAMLTRDWIFAAFSALAAWGWQDLCSTAYRKSRLPK